MTRTSTNRVRVCCAAITPIRNVFPANMLYYTKFFKKSNPFFYFFQLFFIFLDFFLDLKTTARTPHTRTSYSLRMSGVRIGTGHSSILSDPNAMTSQPTNFLSLDSLYSLNCCYGILIRTECSQSEVSFSTWTES